MNSDRLLQRTLRQVQRFVDDTAIPFADGWLVGVSGGADSLALLRLALALGEARGFCVEALHVDHGLRDSSTAEAQRVHALVQTCGATCHVLRIRVDVCGQGLEAAARQGRYLALDQVRTLRQLGMVVVGHSADDQAETVLMRLLTGAGLRGLAAMRPVHGQLARPLLGLRRQQIRLLTQALGMPLVDDPSNRDSRFLRARIRHELLPELQADFGDLTPHLCGLADEANDVGQLIDAVLPLPSSVAAAHGHLVESRERLAQLPRFLRARWLLQALQVLERSPRRARATLAKFCDSLPQKRPFSLHLRGAVVRADLAEVTVFARPLRSGRPEV